MISVDIQGQKWNKCELPLTLRGCTSGLTPKGVRPFFLYRAQALLFSWERMELANLPFSMALES
jgi:hypothetical protein